MGKVVRILHVFGRLDRGGAETMVMNIYRSIDRTKIQFDFLIHTEEKCDYTDEILELGGRIYSISRYNFKNHFKYKEQWEKFFKEHNEYKIIHGHVRSTAAIYLKIAKKYNLRTIAHSHNTSSGRGIKAIGKNILQYPIRYIADYFFACSESAAIWLFGEKKYNTGGVEIIKNPIDTKKYIYDNEIRENVRKELKIEDKFVIGHVGRFHTQKNHEFLLKIFKKIYDVNRDSILLLVGEGEIKSVIENKVEEMGLKKNVIFYGSTSKVNELFQSMDVFVFPSLYEGLGIVAIESQASGLVTICSENIPKEAAITNNLIYMSLEESAESWAKEILENSRYVRKNMYKEICDSGYDILKSKIWFEDFYLNIIDKN